MKNTIIKWFVLFGTCIPFSFLAMYGDATHNMMLLYGILIICTTLITWITVKRKYYRYTIIGFIISGIISYICAINYQSERWTWYFKPFKPTTLVIIFTIIIMLIQLLSYSICSRER